MQNYDGMRVGYRNLWRSMKITRGPQCDRAARVILAARSRYIAVERAVGVPWFVIGLWHMRESANNFAGVLHNGQHIIGTGRLTTLIPKGRGPFSSWEQAAIDALKLKGLHTIKEWPVERIGYESERFNGFGYVARRINSPYVWAGSNHYTSGKYVADGCFDPSHIDKQLGTMPVLAVLCKISPEIDERVNGKRKPTAEVTTGVGGGGAIVTTGVQSGWTSIDWLMFGGFALAAIMLVVWLIHRHRKKEIPAALLPKPVDEPELLNERAGVAVETEGAS